MKKISFFILVLASIVFLFPLLLTFTNSFMSENEIKVNYETANSIFDLVRDIKMNFVDMNFIPRKITFSSYKEVLFYQVSFLVLLVNSIKITIPVVIFNTIISMITAYGFCIWKFKYKESVLYIYIMVMLLPLQAVIVPNYIVFDILNIKDSYLAIILPGIFAPFGTFLLRQNLKAMPIEYFEAAQIDGANKFYILVYIVLPQMRSGITALSMLVFIEYWNVVEQAIIFIKDYYREPLSVYLSRIADGKVGIIFTASCIYMILPIYFLLIGQEHLEKGIELSGVK